MNIDKAKEAAVEFMTHFHPDRVWWIVGGLLRDGELGIEPKDIDIFISGYGKDLLPTGCEDLGDKNAFLLRAYTVDNYPYKGDNYQINLIFMRGDFWDLYQMTDRCDFGICQIGWCPKTNETYRSDQYLYDKYYAVFTLCRETTQERVNRMKDKLPYYMLDNPYNITVDGKKCWGYNKDTQEIELSFEPVLPTV